MPGSSPFAHQTSQQSTLRNAQPAPQANGIASSSSALPTGFSADFGDASAMNLWYQPSTDAVTRAGDVLGMPHLDGYTAKVCCLRLTFLTSYCGVLGCFAPCLCCAMLCCAVPRPALPSSALPFTPQLCPALHCPALHCPAVNCPAPPSTALPSTALPSTALPRPPMPCPPLPCPALLYCALPCRDFLMVSQTHIV